MNLSRSVGNKFISLNQGGIVRTQVVRKLSIFILKAFDLKTHQNHLEFWCPLVNSIILPPIWFLGRPAFPLCPCRATSTFRRVCIIRRAGDVLAWVKEKKRYIGSCRIDPCYFGFGYFKIAKYCFFAVFYIENVP